MNSMRSFVNEAEYLDLDVGVFRSSISFFAVPESPSRDWVMLELFDGRWRPLSELTVQSHVFGKIILIPRTYR